MSADKFFQLWANVRNVLSTRVPDDIRPLVSELLSQADNSRLRGLVAPIEILAGAEAGDGALFNEGIYRLSALPAPDMLEALKAIPDLTILGPFPLRKWLLLGVVEHLVDDEEPACEFIKHPSLATAQTLLGGNWRIPSFPLNLQNEVQRWIAWTALDAWLAHREHSYLSILGQDQIRFAPGNTGSLESELVVALSQLGKGDVDRAMREVRKLLAGSNLSPWRKTHVARAMTRYSPLATTRAVEWLALSPSEPFSFNQAADALDRLSAVFASLITGESTSLDRGLRKVEDELRSFPWVLFCYLVSFPQSGRLAGMLHSLVRRPSDALAWPWPGRATLYADACMLLEDKFLGLGLLDIGTRATGDSSIREGLLAMLESATSSELTALAGSSPDEYLKGYLGGLSPGKQKMLRRGGVWRAIIDGSNVCFGAKSRSAGATPRIIYYDQVNRDLQAAGFTEIISYFDAATRHSMKPSEWELIEQLSVQDNASVVRRFADPYIIEQFLRAPQVTWVVTTDNFDDHLTRYPALREWWPARRAGFHIDHTGNVEWECHFDRPAGNNNR